ncbi:MAG: glycoside hydrolase family 16 protein [Planctomycetota bacterium]
MTRFRISRYLPCLAASAALFAPHLQANGQEIFRDDFDGSGIVDPTVWRLPFGSEGNFVGRTQFRGDAGVDMPPQGVDEALASDGKVAEIYLDTFSPIDPGNQFLGTDLISKRDFARGGGVTFESRMRLVPNANNGGLVNGFFTFDVTRPDPNIEGESLRDEIDFEIIGNQTVGGATQDIFTNVFNDSGFVPANNVDRPEFTDIPGIDLTQFNDYRIEWTPNHVKWYVNDSLIRTETEDVPDDPQKLHFNLWAPAEDFSAAFNAGLQPAAVEGANERFTSQVDHVVVNRINTNVSENLLTDGSFETTVPVLNQPIGTVTDTWYSFNQASVVFGGQDGAPAADDGLFLGKTFGPFFFNSDASGIQQQVPASPGEEFEVSVKAITPSGDSIAGADNFVNVNIAFADASGNIIGTDGSDFPLIDGRDPNAAVDEYVSGTASAKAPEGTAFARVQLLFVQIIDPPGSGGDGGSVFFDSVELVRLTPQGDFNGDGLIDAADYTVWRDNLGASEDLLNSAGDGSGTVDIGDYLLWKSVITGTPVATLSAGLVPEPSTGAVVLLTLTLLPAGRRR